MFELITLVAATTLAFALGFAIAWAKGGKTRELLAAAEARAEEQAYATADKLALVAQLGKELYERVAKLAEYWSDVGDKLGKTVGAYNRSVGTLEGRVLVTARRFVDLKAATETDGELAPPQPVEALPRPLVAPELVGREAVLERVAVRVS